MAKTLDYDFTDPQFDGVQTITAQTGADLTVTRAAASTATVMDYFNVLKTVNADEPRFTGGRRVENLCLESEDFSTTWGGLATTVDDQLANPVNSAVTADKIYPSSTGDFRDKTQTISTSLAGSYVISVYAKAGEFNWLFFRNMDGSNKGAHFNLTTGVVGTVQSGYASSIEDVGSGWHRCSMWNTSAKGATNIAVNIGLSDADNSATATANSTDGLYIYGAQLEYVDGQDDPAPSAYIATTTAAKAQWYATKRRTNILLQSNQFDTTWQSINLDPFVQGASDPEGGTDAWTMTDEGTFGNHCIQQLAFGDTNRRRIYSLYCKQGTARYLAISPRSTFASDAYTSIFDTQAGAWVGEAGISDNYAVTDSGSGWYRISFRLTNSSATYDDLRIGFSNDGTVAGAAYTGSGDTLLLYKLQVEYAEPTTQTAPTAPITTTTTLASSDFDTAITPTGLLIEESRTNLVTWTESLDNAAWVKGAITVDANVSGVTAPDGTETADRFNVDVSDTLHRTYPLTVPTAYSATDVVISCFFKADGNDYPHLVLQGGAVNNFICATYDLTAGTVSQTAVGSTSGTIAGTGIDDVGNGWFRCWLAGQITDASQYPMRYSADSATPSVGTSGQVSYLGVAGEDLLVWGVDFQVGSFATSYIPNDSATASVTRNKDDIQTSSIGTQWNDDAGTIYIDYSVPSTPVANKTFLDITDGGAGADRHLIIPAGAPGDEFKYSTASSGGAAGDASLTSTGDVVAALDTSHKLVCAYADSDAEAYANGTRTGTGDQTVDVPTGIDTLHIGQNYLEGATIGVAHFSRIVYYDERLTDDELEDLSNGTFPSEGLVGTFTEDQWFHRRRYLRRVRDNRLRYLGRR